MEGGHEGEWNYHRDTESPEFGSGRKKYEWHVLRPHKEHGGITREGGSGMTREFWMRGRFHAGSGVS